MAGPACSLGGAARGANRCVHGNRSKRQLFLQREMRDVGRKAGGSYGASPTFVGGGDVFLVFSFGCALLLSSLLVSLRSSPRRAGVE